MVLFCKFKTFIQQLGKNMVGFVLLLVDTEIFFPFGYRQSEST